MHAFTIDLEEWFCTHNFQGVLAYADWERLESRVEAQVTYLLELLARYDVKATFFVLGWVAARHPELIRTLAAEGHEIGCHGYSHQPTWQHTAASFAHDVQQATDVLTSITGKTPKLFRAPAFSITQQTAWAAGVLQTVGYHADSSVYPTGAHPEYGIADAPLAPYNWPEGLRELPLSCATYGGRRLPISGGAYFRLLPYPLYRRLVKRLEAEGRQLNFYLHPWEIDEHLPRVPGLAMQRYLRHYTGLRTTRPKLKQLLTDFRFGTLSHAFTL